MRRNPQLSGSEPTGIGKDRIQNVDGNHTETVKGNIQVTSETGNIKVTSTAGSIQLEAKQQIVFKVGESSIVMDAGGSIQIMGPTRIDLNK